MPIHPTECVSYPRSGHHALVSVLQAYFGNEFHYCESYETPHLKIGQPGVLTNYQKNHDFGMDTELVPGRRYLVQIRHPLEAIESWEEHDLLVGAEPSTPQAKLNQWVWFVNKWLYSPVPQRLVVWYQDLVTRPFEVCTSVIQFITGSQKVNLLALESALARFPLKRRPPRKSSVYIRA